VAAVGRLRSRGVPARRVAMIALLAAFSVVALSAQNPQAVGELRALVRDGPDSVLIERARARPKDAREAARPPLAGAGSGGERRQAERRRPDAASHPRKRQRRGVPDAVAGPCPAGR